MVVRSDDEINEAVRRLSGARAVGCDTETSGLTPRTGKIFSIQFSDGDFACLVPLSEGVRLGGLEPILTGDRITKVFHNARFDLEFLRVYGIRTRNVFCTMIAEKVLTRGADQSASLAETLYRHFAIDLDKSRRSTFSKRWDGIWTEDLVDYALSDVVHLPRLMEVQVRWLERLGLTEEFESQLAKILV